MKKISKNFLPLKFQKRFKMNKKGAMGTTMTWIVAVVIIAGSLAFLVAGVLMIKVAKFGFFGMFFSKTEEKYNPAATIKLIDFLNHPIDDKNVYDMFVNLMKPYLNENFLMEQKINDVNSIYLIDLNKEILLKYGIKEGIGEENMRKLDKVLNEPCKNYIIKFPLGYLYKERGGSLKFVSRDFISSLNEEYLFMFEKAEINIYYNGYIIKIVYQERNFC